MGKRKLAHVVDGEVAEEKEVSLKVAAEGGGGGGGSDEEKSAEVKVIGEMVKKAGGKGKVERRHYQAFEVDGNRYDIVRLLIIISLLLEIFEMVFVRAERSFEIGGRGF